MQKNDVCFLPIFREKLIWHSHRELKEIERLYTDKSFFKYIIHLFFNDIIPYNSHYIILLMCNYISLHLSKYIISPNSAGPYSYQSNLCRDTLFSRTAGNKLINGIIMRPKRLYKNSWAIYLLVVHCLRVTVAEILRGSSRHAAVERIIVRSGQM